MICLLLNFGVFVQWRRSILIVCVLSRPWHWSSWHHKLLSESVGEFSTCINLYRATEH